MMINENFRKKALDKNSISFFNSLKYRFLYGEKLTDEQIEARREDYWKCPECSELNYIDKIVCWKCESSRPKNYEHPGFEELKLDLAKENKSGVLLIGLASLLCAVGVMIHGYLRNFHINPFPDLITIIFTSFFCVFGVILIIIWLIQKAKSHTS